MKTVSRVHRSFLALAIGLLAFVAPAAGDDRLIDSGLVEFAYQAETGEGPTIAQVDCQQRPSGGEPQSGWVCLVRDWDGKFEIGLNGAEGNSRNMNLVIGFDAKRVRGPATTTIDIDYLYSRDDVATTKNRAFSSTRHERQIHRFGGGCFVENWLEHDPLQEFRSRLGLYSGVFAMLLRGTNCEFKGSVGLGTTKDLEGSDTDWRPELYLRAEWERAINDRQQVYVRSTLLPDLGNFGSFLLRTRAGWDVSLNEAETWKLSLSVFDRYDSTPSGTDRKNNVDYWASLAYSF